MKDFFHRTFHPIVEKSKIWFRQAGAENAKPGNFVRKNVIKKASTNTIRQATNSVLKSNKNVLPSSKIFFDDVSNLSSKVFKVLTKSKWGRRITYLGLGIGAYNLLQGGLNRLDRSNERALPSEYERGYDVIRESLTDFGSPVKLSKAAHKVIMPYKSTVRKAVYTTTRSIRNSNLALSLHDNAIGHTRY